MGHSLVDYGEVASEVKEKLEEELPYSLALKAKSNLRRIKSFQFGDYGKKSMKQCFYTGFVEEMNGTATGHVEETPVYQNLNKESGVTLMIISNTDPEDRNFPKFQQQKEGKLMN